MRVVGGVCLLVILGFIGLRGYIAWQAYRSARAEIAALQALAHRDPSTIREADLSAAIGELDGLHANLGTLNDTVSVPVVNRVVPVVPWVGPRYVAARRALLMASVLVAAGQTGARLGEQVFAAFSATGVMSHAAPTGPTWLDVLNAHTADIRSMVSAYDQARAVRATIDDRLLPASLGRQFGTFDRLTARVNVDRLANLDLPAIIGALGENGPQRYMFLFQNWAELRPAGGFPGTVALVTVDRGQIRDYQFFDIHDLTDDYNRLRPAKLPQPWPIAQYFPQDGFLIQDATWYADFPKSGQQFMAMYTATDWPSIDGVVAVEPSLVSDILRVTGPMTVDIDGEQRLITADNVYDEIERPRKLRVEGIITGPENNLHKEALGTIGKALIDRLKAAPRSELMQAGRSVIAAADRRDVQIYSGDPRVEAVLDQQRWSGRLVPDPGVPTLTITYGNLVTDKSSTNLEPTTSLTLSAPSGGRIQATLVMHLKNTGTGPGTDFYEGFQDWWIQLDLPKGSQVISHSLPPEPDPEAPNGGSYRIPLAPGQSGDLTVVFSMPATDALLVRRQPGVATVQLTVAQEGCQVPSATPLVADRTVDLHALCR